MSKIFFPFGRGGRGSRQRVFVQFLQWGGTLRVSELSVGIRQVVGIDISILRVGVSKTGNKRRVFFTSQISQTVRAIKRAVEDFRTIRKTNKIEIDKPARTV